MAEQMHSLLSDDEVSYWFEVMPLTAAHPEDRISIIASKGQPG
jgi:hypothetical protein